MFSGNSIFHGASISGYGDLFDDVMSKGQELISDPSKAVETAKGLIPGGSAAPSSSAPQTQAAPPPPETSYVMPQDAPPVPAAPAACPPGFIGTPPNCRRDAYLRKGLIGQGMAVRSGMTGRAPAPVQRPVGPQLPTPGSVPVAPIMSDQLAPPAPPQETKSNTLWYVGAAVAVVAVGGLAYYLTTRKAD